MAEKLWDGRFSQDTDSLVEKFTSSIDVDKRLFAHDIKGSIAHAKMLARESIITESEGKEIVKGLEQIKKDIEDGNFQFSDSLEDIHMHIESALGKKVGKAARKLHTGRSRNDQVALDIRMYVIEETKNIIHLLRDLQKILVKNAGKHMGIVMPGYTHIQRAQPVLFSHHLMAYYEMFKRDAERFEDSLKRSDVMPLGAAALAGTTYPLNREYTKELLGFSKISDNSMDSVADRDFIIEFISCASISMIHLSRLSEEFVLWSSSEFAFITISDAFTTGSSIMPQKKNPDVSELVRGKTARVAGNLMSIITLMKSLPMTYNRDMQEDKEPLFDTVDTLKACLGIYIAMVDNIVVNKDTMYSACQHGFLNATDLADYLVRKGMPFRQAHSVSGKAVAYALKKKKELHQLSIDELRQCSDLIDKDVFEYLSVEKMIARRITHGGTGYETVKNAIEKAVKELIEKPVN